MRRFVLGLSLIASLLLAACASPTATTAPVHTNTQAATATEVSQPTETEPPAAETPADPFDINPADYSGDITMAGSSTVYPVSERIVEMFNAEGFEGKGIIKLDSIGSGAGF